MILKNLLAGFFVCCILISSAAGAADDGAKEMVNKSKNLSLPVKSPGNITLGSKESMYQYQQYMKDSGKSLLDSTSAIFEIFGLGNQADTQKIKDITEKGLNKTNTDGKLQSIPQPATTQDLSSFLDDDAPPPVPTDLTLNSMSVVTASTEGNTVFVNYLGGLDRDMVNTIEVQFTPAGGTQSKKTFKNVPGTQITFNQATLWKDHIVVLAIRTDGTKQVIYDDYI